ncbi:ADP-ribose pyrophosphatase [Lactobacillus delbrueckii subsp. delbrueckii DSM 20074 = JCM 1012]|nr:ADP-ribose pyrophosphatase [Lactobacillus delbrueckii subsp. delbrueckii DSM 20074 = JCM 1012]
MIVVKLKGDVLMPELEKIVERPLITITNLIWSFNKETHRVQLLLVKRKDEPFADRWALPETLLRENESADQAAVRLIKEKTPIVKLN